MLIPLQPGLRKNQGKRRLGFWNLRHSRIRPGFGEIRPLGGPGARPWVLKFMVGCGVMPQEPGGQTGEARSEQPCTGIWLQRSAARVPDSCIFAT